MSISSTFYFIESTTNQIVSWDNIPEIFNVSEQICSELQKKLTEMILELNNCFKNNGHELWEQVIFSLGSNGKFNINFRYNIMNESDGGQLAREIIWAYDTFRYIPASLMGNRINRITVFPQIILSMFYGTFVP